LELRQSRCDKTGLEWGIALADDLLARFEDAYNGGFFFTAHDHETLIHRPKSMADEAMPSGNGVAAYALNRLAHVLGELRYSQAAERVLQAAMPALQDYPQACGSLAIALEEWAKPGQLLILRGDPANMATWQREALGSYAPTRLCLAIPASEASLPGILAERQADHDAVAYVCEATTCLPPIQTLEEFRAALARNLA
jgi:hypothetical protein